MVLAFVIQLFGIVIPRKLTAQNAEKILFPLMWLVSLSYYIGLPFEKLLSFIAYLILLPFGVKSDSDEEDVTEEEFKKAVAELDRLMMEAE